MATWMLAVTVTLTVIVAALQTPLQPTQESPPVQADLPQPAPAANPERGAVATRTPQPVLGGAFEWNSELKLGDLLTTLATLVAAAALVFAALQSRTASEALRHSVSQFATERKSKRLDKFLEIMSLYFSDKETVKTFHDIDRGEWVMDRDGKEGLIKLLNIFDYISKLVDDKEVRKEDLSFFLYQMDVVFRNKQVKMFINDLDRWYQLQGVGSMSYPSFRSFAAKLSARPGIAGGVPARDPSA